MNRLILVGNGFDLAHGLKTSYCDFISSYLSSAINLFYEKWIYTDELITIKMRLEGDYLSAKVNCTAENTFLILHQLSENKHCIVDFHSEILKKTYNSASTLNWVDIENEYFKLLTNLTKSPKVDYSEISLLNTEMESLKNRLQSYLQSLKGINKDNIDPNYLNMFMSEIYVEDLVDVKDFKTSRPENILFLSFNYTETVFFYQRMCTNHIHSDFNYIHGQLWSDSNPIVFGFGDEYDKEYLRFEELQSHELFQHIKSFAYFRTKNYHELIRFLDSNFFQVLTVGHSLGLSDRTLLKQIFEHKNCKSVKIAYHKISNDEDDFTQKTYAISSHFTNKIEMRKKILPKPYCITMPQSIKT